MKNYRILLLVPFIALTGCQSQRKISVEKAKEIATQISTTTNYDSFVFNLSNKGGIGKGDDKVTVDLTYELRYNAGNTYSLIKGHDGSGDYDAEMYYAKNTKHGDVKFVRYYDAEKNEYIKSVSTSNYDENFDQAFAELGVLRPTSLFNYYDSLACFELQLDEGDTLNLYSNKDGQLTIEYVTDLKTVGESKEEKTSKGKVVFKYDNYRFISAINDTSSTFGNTWTTRGSVDYETPVDVELPSDWESYLKLEA